ncbi:hypothetical protein SAMN05880501_101610 [Ureibacillus xyleni]|uniref:Uncharacterized protein n=1 Tax=Ureibacillus xyleni TaxID=614648 RepID=A0A285RL23_9BACL|nr:hypothetical protein [Ureibacillus xyleni]SOB93142.1 hypothetical protein SAMN05880501_101610 [Ureibacillus xyleni]
MMFGSIFYNCWASLISFSIYFVVTLLNSYSPTHILIGSFIVAIITFIIMFPFRNFLFYIFYTPEEKLFEKFQAEIDKMEVYKSEDDNNMMNGNTSVEFNDQSSEDIAKVVRTMMNEEVPI